MQLQPVRGEVETAQINSTEAGTITVKAATSGARIHLSQALLLTAGASQLLFKDSDGTALTPTLNCSAGFVLPYSPCGWLSPTATGKGLSLEQVGSGTISGVIKFIAEPQS